MSEPIKVLQVFAQMNRGGAETMIMNLYRQIDRSKVQFDFIVHTEKKCAFDDEIEQLGGKIYRVPRYTGKNHFSYKKAWVEFFKTHPNYKIIHGHVRSTASIYLRIANKYKLTSIAHSHSTASRGNVFQKNIKNIMQFPIRFNADYMFACSYEAGEWLFGKNNTNKQNFRLIKNAIDIDTYLYNDTIRKSVRKEFCIEDYFVIGHVGSFTYPKNHNLLIDVFKEVHDRNNNAVLMLVGDGELRKIIKAKVDKLKLSDSVIFTGVRGDVPVLFQAMDVLVFPSLYEGLPVTLVEAQANGLNCIVSDRITDEVDLGLNLMHFNNLNTSISHWADLILDSPRIRNYNQDITTKMIQKADYDVTNIAKKLMEFYEERYR